MDCSVIYKGLVETLIARLRLSFLYESMGASKNSLYISS